MENNIKGNIDDNNKSYINDNSESNIYANIKDNIVDNIFIVDNVKLNDDNKINKIRSRKIIKIGLAFECQKFGNIPVEKHDQKMNYIVTEKGVIKCQ